MDPQPGIVLIGNIPREPVAGPALKFGWRVESAEGFEHLRKLRSDRRVVAVLFEPHAFGWSWERALGGIRDATPGALAVICRRFSEAVDWPALAALGAFHMISLPVDESEMRQSLGFIWGATRRIQKTQELTNRVKAAQAGQLIA